MSHWKDSPIHVIDFEGSRRTGIVEYGAVTVENGRVAATSSRLCRPRATLAEEDTRLHGIRQAEVEGLRPFAEEWERFTAMRANGPFAAHHAPVEDSLIRQSWPAPRLSPDFAGMRADSASWGPWLDTRRLYERLYPGLESYKLGDLAAAFGLLDALNALAAAHCPEKRGRWHCALYDAMASALLLLRLDEETDLRGMSLGWLMQQGAASEGAREAMRQQELF